MSEPEQPAEASVVELLKTRELSKEERRDLQARERTELGEIEERIATRAARSIEHVLAWADWPQGPPGPELEEAQRRVMVKWEEEVGFAEAQRRKNIVMAALLPTRDTPHGLKVMQSIHIASQKLRVAQKIGEKILGVELIRFPTKERTEYPVLKLENKK